VRTADLNPSGRGGPIVGQDLFVFGDVDGSEENVRLQHPIGIAYQEGVVYIADTYNHKIKKILPNTRGSFTVLGSGQAGSLDGPGKQAQFSEPSGPQRCWRKAVHCRHQQPLDSRRRPGGRPGPDTKNQGDVGVGRPNLV